MPDLDQAIDHGTQVVFVGDEWTLRVPCFDGDRDRRKPYGMPKDYSAPADQGFLTVKVTGGDVTRDTSVGAEGAKVDTSGDGNADAFDFYLDAAGWPAGTYAWYAERRNAQERTVAYGVFDVRAQA